MFRNVGKKIKIAAEIIGGLGIGLSAVYCVVLSELDALMRLLVFIVGAFSSWMSACALYGFGELVETSRETRDMTYELLHGKVVRPNAGVQPKTTATPAGSWVCACGRHNIAQLTTCVCGRTKNEKKQEPTDAQ